MRRMRNDVSIEYDTNRNAANDNQQYDVDNLPITNANLVGRIDLSRRKEGVDLIEKDHSATI